MRRQFLHGAEVVADAIADPLVAAAWHDPSVLDRQTVGSLACHVGWGTVTLVETMLDQAEPAESVNVDTAAHYFAMALDQVGDDELSAIRDRGAELAAAGHTALVDGVAASLDRLRGRLYDIPAGRKVSAFGGYTMLLEDYLWTRIVEQVVHLDDLARSIGSEPWPNPPDSEALVISFGAEVGRRRRGARAMITALYRDDPPEGTLPVM